MHAQELYGSVPRIRTPRIIWAHTARRVLCMEWIDGVKLTDKEAMAAAGLDIVDFVDVGIECTLRQLLESGLFHADPHPYVLSWLGLTSSCSHSAAHFSGHASCCNLSEAPIGPHFCWHIASPAEPLNQYFGIQYMQGKPTGHASWRSVLP
jgi:hypothetical protein